MKMVGGGGGELDYQGGSYKGDGEGGGMNLITREVIWRWWWLGEGGGGVN